jgi:hypothetical protein
LLSENFSTAYFQQPINGMLKQKELKTDYLEWMPSETTNMANTVIPSSLRRTEPPSPAPRKFTTLLVFTILPTGPKHDDAT